MIACAHGGRQAPADQVLRRVAERAEEEEVEDDDRRQRRERDRNPASDESSAHSSVHSSGSVLLRPLPMNLEPRIASEISAEPISTERGVVSQPSSEPSRPPAEPGSAATGAGPGWSARICWDASKSGRPVGAGDGIQPCQVSLRLISVALRCTSGK